MNRKNYVIAAVRSREDILTAVSADVKIVFHLLPNIETIKEDIGIVHDAGKKLFVHIDLAEGIGKDKYGIAFLKKIGIDGIISTRANIIKSAAEMGMYTIQRFFIVDSHSVETTVESLKGSKVDMIEIMPGVSEKIIRTVKSLTDKPIIAGGLIETKDEVMLAVEAGASAVSTGKQQLWYL